MNVIGINSPSGVQIKKIKKDAIKLIEENDSFVLLVKRPGEYSFSSTPCNIKEAELVMMGGFLIHEGASGYREIDKQG